jgi:hypothetical protein
MSRLENRVKYILIPLMTGRPITLNKYNQEILATWIAAKMMVADFMAPNDVFFSSMRQAHRLLVAPKGVIPVIPREPIKSNIQQQTFVIGELLVQTRATTVKELSTKTPKGDVFDRMKWIWPYQADVTWPPHNPVLDPHARVLITGFERFIESLPRAHGAPHR